MRTLFTRTVLSAALGGSVAALAGAGGAAAAPAAATPSGFAGYQLTVAAPKSGSTQFRVPDEKCHSTPSGILAGIFDANKMLVTAYVQCNKGSTAVEGGLYVYLFGKSQNLAVSPGDDVMASFSTKVTTVTVSVVDTTTGKSVKVSNGGTLTSAIRVGVDYLSEPGIRKVPPGPFGSLTFASATIDGKSIAGDSPVATTWISVKGSTLVECGKLGSAGTFTATRT